MLLLLRELRVGGLLERGESAAQVRDVLLERGFGPDQRTELLALLFGVSHVAGGGAVLVEQ